MLNVYFEIENQRRQIENKILKNELFNILSF